MDITKIRILLVVASFSIMTGHAFAACNVALLSQCITPFNTNDITQLFQGTVLTSADVTSICNDFTNAENCVSTFAGCTASDSEFILKWSITQQQFQYLCSSGRQDFINNQACLGKYTLAELSGQCNPRSFDSPSVRCRILSNQSSCYLLMIPNLPNCTSAAAKFFATFEAAIIDAQLNALKCATMATTPLQTTTRPMTTTRLQTSTTTRPLIPVSTSTFTPCAVAPTCQVSTCNQYILNTVCTSTFHSFDYLFSGVYSWTTQQLNDTCNLLTATNDCVLNTAGCADKDPLTASWLPRKYSYGYICNEGKADFILQQSCLGAYSYATLTGTCIPATPPTKSNICTTYTNALNCVQARVTAMNSCNVNSASVFTSYLKKQFVPALCILDKSCSLLVSSSTLCP